MQKKGSMAGFYRTHSSWGGYFYVRREIFYSKYVSTNGRITRIIFFLIIWFQIQRRFLKLLWHLCTNKLRTSFIYTTNKLMYCITFFTLSAYIFESYLICCNLIIENNSKGFKVATSTDIIMIKPKGYYSHTRKKWRLSTNILYSCTIQKILTF